MASTISSFLFSPMISSISADDIRKSNRAYSNALDVVKSMPIIVTQPVNSKQRFVSNGLYKDLNQDKTVQKTLAKYYYYKILDKWIYNDLFPLLAFIDTSSSKTQLIKGMEDFDTQKLTKESDDIIEKKIDYLENILLTKDMVRHVLKKICLENNINWYDLNKYEKQIKKVFYNYLLDKLKYAINKYGNISSHKNNHHDRNDNNDSDDNNETNKSDSEKSSSSESD
jgi:hypothetical protein